MTTVESDIYLSNEEEEDTYYEIFRRLSHKVASCRYDIPWGHKVIVAYLKTHSSGQPLEAIGVITFSMADETSEKPILEEHFMSSCFHTISFLFVDQRYQRTGVGTKLLNQAIRTIRSSELQRPIHIEAAKPAVKFFQKMGFTLFDKAGKSSKHGSHLFRKCFYMQYQLHRAAVT